MEKLKIRKLRLGDLKQLYELRCSEDVKRFSLGPAPTWDQHKEFVADTVSAVLAPLYVAEVDGEFAGCARATKRFGVVDVSVVKHFRKKGVASALVEFLKLGSHTLQATVHKDNRAAQKLFTKLGFVQTNTHDDFTLWMWRKDND